MRPCLGLGHLYLQLFGIEPALETAIGIGTCWMLFFFAMNIISASASGWFQNAATVIKIIPLIIIGFAGNLLGQLRPDLPAGKHRQRFVVASCDPRGGLLLRQLGSSRRPSPTRSRQRKNLPSAHYKPADYPRAVHPVLCRDLRADQTSGDHNGRRAPGPRPILIFGPVGEKVIGVIIVISVVRRTQRTYHGHVPDALFPRNPEYDPVFRSTCRKPARRPTSRFIRSSRPS